MHLAAEQARCHRWMSGKDNAADGQVRAVINLIAHLQRCPAILLLLYRNLRFRMPQFGERFFDQLHGALQANLVRGLAQD